MNRSVGVSLFQRLMSTIIYVMYIRTLGSAHTGIMEVSPFQSVLITGGFTVVTQHVHVNVALGEHQLKTSKLPDYTVTCTCTCTCYSVIYMSVTCLITG